MKSTASLTVLALAAVAQALPNVTPVARPTGCAGWPNYRPEGFPDPFILWADSTDVELPFGAGSTVGDLEVDGVAGARIGIGARGDLAKVVLNCEHRAGMGQTLGANYDNGWRPVTLGATQDNLYLLYDQVGGAVDLPVQAHDHFAEDGTQIPGTFVGFGNRTTWAFLRETNANGVDQYRVRLLTLSTQELEEGEFKGFIRAGNDA